MKIEELRASLRGRREVRAAPLELERERRDNGQPAALRGHAAVFDDWTQIGEAFRERIAPGAFRQALADHPDVLLLWGHDSNAPLARTGAGLDVHEDSRGLAFRAELPATTLAADVAELVARGVVRGCSFAFTVAEDRWNKAGDGTPERTILRFERVFELTITSVPAYESTDVSADRHAGELAEVRARTDAAVAKARGRLQARPRSPYGPDSKHSWFRDRALEAAAQAAADEAVRSGLSRLPALSGLALSGWPEENRDQGSVLEAVDRLERFRGSAEARDVGTGAFAGLVSIGGAPSFVVDAVATAVRGRAAVAAALPNGPLPEQGMDVVSGGFTTAGAVAVQATENTAVAEADAATTSRTSPLALVAGQIDPSRQALERLASGAMDVILAKELGASLATAIDGQVLSGTGASGQTRGLLNVSGITTVTWTDATPTPGELVENIWTLASRTAVAYGGPIGLLIAHPRRLDWLEGKAASAAAPFQPRLPGRIVEAGTIPTNIGAGTNEDVVIALCGLDTAETAVLTSPATVEAFPEGGNAPATIRFTIRQYVALVATQPAAVGVLTGTGMLAAL